MKCFLIAVLSAMLFPTFISETTLNYSNSIFPIVFLLGCYFLLRQAGKERAEGRALVFSHILGFLFSVMTAYGYALSNMGRIDYLNPLLIASILLFAHLFGEAFILLWRYLSKAEDSFFFAAGENLCAEKLRGNKRLLDCLYRKPARLFVLLLLTWLPCYISTFPGNFVYDASYEYYQLADGFTRSYPLLHSVIITRLFSFFERLTGSVNPGIAVYTIAQMLAASALFTHILRKFYSDGMNTRMLAVLTLYYAVFPVIHLLITCTTREVLFSLLITWLMYLLYLIAKNPEQIFASVGKTILFAWVFVLALLARNNNSGPLAALLLVVVCAAMIVSFGRRYFKGILIFASSSFVIFYGLSAVLVSLCQPLYESPPSSSMSILAQPIVRAYMYYGDTWPEEDRAEFDAYFTLETLEYFPQNADPAKGNLDVRYANMKEFLSFWIKIGLRHPACYMDAVLAGTQQMWFPSSVLDGYTVRGMFSSYDKNYFYFGEYIEEIGSRLNLLPAVFRFYEQIGMMISFERIPVISMLFSVGFHVWLLLHSVFYTIYRKKYMLLWPMAVLLIYTVCSAFVPLVLLRYFAALFFALPITVVIALSPATRRIRLEE